MACWHFFIFTLNGCNTPNASNSEQKTDKDTNTTTALEYINFLRVSSGLSSLTENSTLNQAALNHSKYLSFTQEFAHEEYNTSTSYQYYTGKDSSNRAQNIGYPTNYVSENLATSKSELLSIDALFTAIYHRFGFFKFDIDEIGYGSAPYSLEFKTFVYTYNMGSNALSELCTNTKWNKLGPYYDKLCTNGERQNSTKYDEIMNNYYNSSPDFVVFPYKNATNITPVFYSEIPDPLPDHYMTANPISVQFNPKYDGNVSVNSFTLKNLNTGESIVDINDMNESTDPAEKFDNFQFAYFPLKRLDYNTKYEATIVYAAPFSNGLTTYSWEFTTTTHEKILIVKNSGDTLSVKSGVEYVLYFESTLGASLLQSSENSSYGASLPVGSNIEFIDSMTYKIVLTGKKGDKGTIINKSLNNGTSVNLIIE